MFFFVFVLDVVYDKENLLLVLDIECIFIGVCFRC